MGRRTTLVSLSKWLFALALVHFGAVAFAKPCPGCGRELPDAAFFCADCGRDLRPGADAGGGVGAEVHASEAGVAVVAVLPGGAAEKAGIQAGWTIESVDGQTTRGMTIENAAKLLRGEVGSNVQLGLRTAGGELKVVTVARSKLVLGLPRVRMVAEGIGLIGLPLLTAETPGGVRAAVTELRTANAFIIDLRGTRGGYLEALEHVAGMFLRKGAPLWVVEMKDGTRSIVKSPGPGEMKAPVAILIDGATQGGELLASAFKTRNRGILIGQKTPGSSAVRKVDEKVDGTAAFREVGRFMADPTTPLSGVGVTPDRVLPADAAPEDYVRAAVEELRKAAPADNRP